MFYVFLIMYGLCVPSNVCVYVFLVMYVYVFLVMCVLCDPSNVCFMCVPSNVCFMCS